MPVMSLRHRGYLYAQEVFMRMRSPHEQHPTIQRMRIGDAWREGYLEAQRDAMRAVKQLNRTLDAAERVLANGERP